MISPATTAFLIGRQFAPAFMHENGGSAGIPNNQSAPHRCGPLHLHHLSNGLCLQTLMSLELGLLSTFLVSASLPDDYSIWKNSRACLINNTGIV